MKLSEIIKNCDTYTENILLFNKYEKPYIRIIKSSEHNDKYLDKEYLIFTNINSNVNLEFLCYYLRLNMRLLRNNSSEFINQFGLDHLNVEFINNIEISNLPNVEVQNKLAKIISELYDTNIESVDNKIIKLLDKSRLSLQNDELYTESRMKLGELFEITDMKLFFKNVLKGKFKNNYEEYINILRPDLLSGDYLVLRLYFDKVLYDESNYYVNENNIKNFDISNMIIPITSRKYQIVPRVLMALKNEEKIMPLRKKQRRNKLILRALLNNL
jgi:hypothetical protein